MRHKAILLLPWHLVACLLLLLGPLQVGAETAAEVDQEITRIKSEIASVERKKRDREFEQNEIGGFQSGVWTKWIAPWNKTLKAIDDQKRDINQAIGSQDSRVMNNALRTLEKERDRLMRLDGQPIEGCGSVCRDMHALIDFYNSNHRRWETLKDQIATLELERQRLYRDLDRQKAKRAASDKARNEVLKADLHRKQKQRDEFAELLRQTDKILMPNLDGHGPPRLLTVEELIIEIGNRYYAAGGKDEVDSAEFERTIRRLAQEHLSKSGLLRQLIGKWIKILEADINALKVEIDDGVAGVPAPDTSGLPGNCPHRNPDPTLATNLHRFPSNDADNNLTCAYFSSAEDSNDPGRLKSQVRYKDGKETGVAAYFTLEDGYHLDHIHNVHGPLQSGAKCTYFSASAIREYRLFGHDGTEMVVFCEPDGTAGQCDYITHDGRARRCSADCRDKCADLRKIIGWSAMQ